MTLRKPDSDWWRYQPRRVPGQLRLRRALAVQPTSTREQAAEILARPGAVSSTGMLNPRVVSRDEARVVAQARAEAELAAGPKPQFKAVSPGEVVGNIYRAAAKPSITEAQIEALPGWMQPIGREVREMSSPRMLALTALTAGVGPAVAKRLGGVALGAAQKKVIATLAPGALTTAKVGRAVVSGVLQPVVRGGFGRRFAAEQVLGVGGGMGARAAAERVPETAPTAVKVGAGLAGGLAGGLLTVAGIRGAEAGGRAGTRAGAKVLTRIPQAQVQEAGLRLVGAGGGVAGGAEGAKSTTIESIIAAFKRKTPMATVVERADLMGTDGKLYGPNGFPRGVEWTGKRGTPYFVKQSKEGQTYGKRFASEAEALADIANRVESEATTFRTDLEQMSDARLEEQRRFWVGDKTTAPVGERQPAPRRPRAGRKLPTVEAISDFDPMTQTVVRRGNRTFIVDKAGQRADTEVVSDVLTPQTEANLRALTPEQQSGMEREIRRTPILSQEGKAERLAILEEMKAPLTKPVPVAPRRQQVAREEMPPIRQEGAAPAAKEPWEMTQDELRQSIRLGTIKARGYKASVGEIDRAMAGVEPLLPGAHYRAVRQALSEGKPVPANVLADYPDLAVMQPVTPVAEQVAPPRGGIEAKRQAEIGLGLRYKPPAKAIYNDRLYVQKHSVRDTFGNWSYEYRVVTGIRSKQAPRSEILGEYIPRTGDEFRLSEGHFADFQPTSEGKTLLGNMKAVDAQSAIPIRTYEQLRDFGAPVSRRVEPPGGVVRKEAAGDIAAAPSPAARAAEEAAVPFYRGLSEIVGPNRALFREYDLPFRRIFGTPMRPYQDLITGFDITKFDDELLKSGSRSMEEVLRERYGEEAVRVIRALVEPPRSAVPSPVAPAPGRTPRVRRTPLPPKGAQAKQQLEATLGEIEEALALGRAPRVRRTPPPVPTFEEHRALGLRREARAMELRAAQADALGEDPNLAKGYRDAARQLDAEAESLTPPPQVGAPGAAPVEAAGVAPPAPAAEQLLRPRVPGGPRAVPLEPRPALSRTPLVEPGVGPPGGKLPSGREVGGPGRAQPPPPRDPYGMLKASLEPERDPLIGRLRTALPQELYDRNFPLKELEQATGIQARKAAQVVPGAAAAGEDIVRRFYAPIVKMVEKDLKFLERYMVLMRDSDILARNPHARLPGGIASEGERQTAMAALQKEIGAERFAKIKQAAEDLWRVNDEQVLKPWFEEGIISADMYREMSATHPHYIPFMRDDFAEVIHNSFSARPEANLSTIGIKRMGMEGSERALSNPLLRLLQQPIKSKQTIFRNRAAKSIVRALEELQRQTGEEVVKYIDPKKEMNIVQRVTGQNIPRLKKGEISQQWETISFFENGVKNRVEVPSIYGRVAKGLEAEPDNILLATARVLNAPLRLGATTFNPWFTPVNIIRDAMSAMFREKVFPFGPDYMAGLWAAIRKNADYSEAAQQGVLLGGLIDDMSRRRVLKNPLGGITVKNPWEAVTLIPRLIEEANIIAERGVRVATFRKLRAEGVDALEAAVRSRDATVDFAKSGHSMRVINQVVPFTNAAVQGTANIVRTIRDHPARSAAFAIMFAGITVAERVNNMRFETSELIPDYEYTRNWVIQFGEGTRADGTKYPIYLKIPKGEIAAVFTFVPEAMFHLARKSEDRSAVELLLSQGLETGRVVSPIDVFSGKITDIFPPLIETGVGLQTGVDPFTGFQIVPERLKGLPPEQQFTGETSQTAIQIGRLFKVSPMLVDFALNDVAAGGGQTLNWLNSMGLEALGVDVEAFGSGDPDADIQPTGLEKLAKERTPGLSRFVGARDTQLVRRGYDNLVDAVVDTNRAIGNFPDVSRLGIKFGQVGSTIDGVELSPQQKARYQERAGQLAIESLVKLQAGAAYSLLTDALKEAAIRNIFDLARKQARATMLRDVLAPSVPQPTAPGRLRPPSGGPVTSTAPDRLRPPSGVRPTPTPGRLREPVGAR